ncbi:hypothetical protein GWI33_005911 [Rhynchophorus ferrugineus]|uniref:Carboxylesterase type B domain-containing protein n=1 Tax=Rhynchophorus ferrugineus TaxID=354439 RepID=A0A834J3F2_RHYFE|nr:hypothetical protein GWI33_005911 [Rhynchophorus ferrugineus]
MCYITKSMTIIITLYSVSMGDPNIQFPRNIQNYNDFRMPMREIILKKQGRVQGMVIRPGNELPLVEVYRGIPYAAPPVGHLRFMPPSSTLYTWPDVKQASVFGPVCPQKFPNESTMTEERKAYFSDLKTFLTNESEDCLYLNIYAPYQGECHHPIFLRSTPLGYTVPIFICVMDNSGHDYGNEMGTGDVNPEASVIFFRTQKDEDVREKRRGTFGKLRYYDANTVGMVNVINFSGIQ